MWQYNNWKKKSVRLKVLVIQIQIPVTNKTQKMCELLTKCEVKMVGYWPSSFFACLWTETEVHKLAKKERGQFPAILTEQTWSIKDFYMAFGELFLAGRGG